MIPDYTNKCRGPFTIAIIGGGLAGCAAGYALARTLYHQKGLSRLQYRIQLYEMSTSSTESNIIAVTLANHRTTKIIATGDFVVAGEINTGASRQIFDNADTLQQLLEQASELGLQVYRGWWLNNVSQKNGRVSLEFVVADQKNKVVKADFVIDASGKVAAFARSLDVKRQIFDQATFLQTLVNDPLVEGALLDCELTAPTDVMASYSSNGASLSNTFVEAVEQGWWYAARMPNAKMLVSFCTDKKHIEQHHYDEPQLWQSLLRQTAWLRHQVPQSLLELPANCLEIKMQTEPSSLLSNLYGDRWLAVGDAACCYDPISSSGVTNALKHADMAATAIAQLILDHNTEGLLTYQQRVLEDFECHIGVGNRLSACHNSFEQAQFWYRCFAAF